MSSQDILPLSGGIVCALVTPFGTDEKLDEGALKELIDFQTEAGVHGIFVGGTAGEGPLMLREERRLLTESAVGALSHRIPLVVHCGAPDTRTAEHIARHAEALGADAAATVGPYFYRPDPEQLYAHFRSVAEAAPGIAHFIYENSERVGYPLGVALVGRLVREVPSIVGVKDTGDSIGRMTSYLSTLDPLPEVYAGNNAVILPALTIGARGAVSALSNVVPELFVKLYESHVEGDLDAAGDMQRTAARLQGALVGIPYVPAIKHLVGKRGLPATVSRRPYPPLTGEQIRHLEDRLAPLDDVRSWLDAPAG